MKQQADNLFRYRGTSMWPCFQEGDLLEIAPLIDGQTIRRGDCVVWRDAEGRYVVHRVVGIRGGLQTRGDALAHNDLAGPSSELLGRVVRRYRLGRRSTVAGGFYGRLAGSFYRYAGRIDPERDARGGRLARGLRGVCAPLLHPWLRKEYHQDVDGGRNLSGWTLGGITLAGRNPDSGNWQVAWPWRMVIVLPVDE